VIFAYPLYCGVNYASDFTRLRRISIYLLQLYTNEIKHVQKVTTINDYIIRALNISTS